MHEVYRAAEWHLDEWMFGDSALDQIEHATDNILKRTDCDDYLVFVFSDADLSTGQADGRRLTPQNFAKALSRNPKVTASAFFVAEPEDARWLAEGLPKGKGHVCLDASDLPRMFAQVFAKAMQGGS